MMQSKNRMSIVTDTDNYINNSNTVNERVKTASTTNRNKTYSHNGYNSKEQTVIGVKEVEEDEDFHPYGVSGRKSYVQDKYGNMYPNSSSQIKNIRKAQLSMINKALGLEILGNEVGKSSTGG